MPSFIASCSFILPPLLHSFSITGLQNLCKGCPAFMTNTVWTSQSPPIAISSCLLGLLINENSDNQGWFWVTLISACPASSGANCSLLMWLSSFIPCRYLEGFVFQSQDHTSVILCEKYSTSRQKSLCSDWLFLAPLEIGIWSGQTDCYADHIGIAIFSCIICARQTNGTARSQLSGQVNFCPRILKQRYRSFMYAS